MTAAKSGLCFVYSTFPGREAAMTVGRVLVERRLAACVNVLGPMRSIYEWQGTIEAGDEVAAFIKTRRSLVGQVIEAARPLHPYTTPCFLVLPIDAGNRDYLDWARAQTDPPKKRPPARKPRMTARGKRR